MNAPILSIKDLSVHFDTNDGRVEAVKQVSMRFEKGETVAIVGESGSGKSQTMMAVMGLLANNGKANGSIQFNQRELLVEDKSALNQIRGARITMIFQEPMTSLDPLYRIGSQICEPIIRHSKRNKKQAIEHAVELLSLVDIQDPHLRINAFPHELSGGQRQRVMIAMALANDPDLLIADEPTTALDVTVQKQILELLKKLQNKLNMTVAFITHDLNIVKRIAERVYVMQSGKVVEHNHTAKLFSDPQHAYTRQLLNAEPQPRSQNAARTPGEPIIEAKNISVTFQKSSGLFSTKQNQVKAVINASISLNKGQTLGIVGESGSGKSTLARALLRLLAFDGQVFFKGQDISTLNPEQLRILRRQMQLIFQDPFGSLSPRMTIGDVIGEGLLIHEKGLSRAMREKHVIKSMAEVGLDPAMRNRYPHEFSGGQRQRIAIARSIILKPELIVLDEPTSALDRTIQKQIIELLQTLQQNHTLSFLFISHDLAVVRTLADHVIVMKQGQIIESGYVDTIFEYPEQPYTRELISAAFDQSK